MKAHKPIRKGRATNSLATPPQSKVSEDLDKADEKPEGNHRETPARKTDAPQSQHIMDLNTIAEKAALAAQSAIQGFDMNQSAAAPHFPISSQPQPIQIPPSPPPEFSYHFPHQSAPTTLFHGSPYQQSPASNHQVHHQPAHTNPQHDLFSASDNLPGVAVTYALYERARMAETSKASPSTRRAGHPSQRRPWSPQEEAALLDGLDRVRGPHWSQILAMYGAGGSVSEALKDRNQVQLKDKARNFKLYFLKNNIQLPYSLSLVTGELRTRAPAQAAKNEAEERERLSEECGCVEGGTTLAPALGEENGTAAEEADRDGTRDDGVDSHIDRHETNTNQGDVSMEKAQGTSIEKNHDHQQPPSETIDDMQNISKQNNPSEYIKPDLAQSSSARLQNLVE